MKTISYTVDALADLRTHRGQAQRIMAKIKEYASTGAGQIKDLSGIDGKRLRVGDFRVIFEETETTILVTKIGPRGSVYE